MVTAGYNQVPLQTDFKCHSHTEEIASFSKRKSGGFQRKTMPQTRPVSAIRFVVSSCSREAPFLSLGATAPQGAACRPVGPARALPGLLVLTKGTCVKRLPDPVVGPLHLGLEKRRCPALSLSHLGWAWWRHSSGKQESPGGMCQPCRSQQHMDLTSSTFALHASFPHPFVVLGDSGHVSRCSCTRGPVLLPFLPRTSSCASHLACPLRP